MEEAFNILQQQWNQNADKKINYETVVYNFVHEQICISNWK